MIKIEKLILANKHLLDSNICFKVSNLCGYFSHIFRDMIFYYGIINNEEYALPN